jgi:hypothetical protein
MTYNPNIPLPTDFLSDSQGDIRTNFTTANSAFSVDHTPFPTAINAGYHKPVHNIKQSVNPANVADTNILFAKTWIPTTVPPSASGDVQLFALTAAGIVSQLTGFRASAEGFQWIGGLLIQWGVVNLTSGGAGTSTHRTGTVTFTSRVASTTPAFPTNCFLVLGNLIFSDSTDTTNSNTLTFNAATTTKFDWMVNSSTSSLLTKYPNFYWIALGN